METYISFANDNLWSEIWPELWLCLGAILVLGIDLFTKSSGPKVRAGNFAILFQSLLIVTHLLDYLLLRHTFDRESFSGMLKHGIHQDIMRSFFLLSSLLVSIIAHTYLKSRKLRIGEFHHLSMIATAGLMILCQAQHFIVVFVALETVALCFYPLVAFNRESPQSLEAGMKYLIFGALSSALFLLGIVLLYGVGSNPVAWGATLPASGFNDAFSFSGLYQLIFTNSDHLLLRAGVVLIISGIAFKIGAAPFQIWVPDVYHGSRLFCTLDFGEWAFCGNERFSASPSWFCGHIHNLFWQFSRLFSTKYQANAWSIRRGPRRLSYGCGYGFDDSSRE
jgi:NADH-quinone oxidoreductase subunit N